MSASPKKSPRKTRAARWPLWPLRRSERGKPRPVACFRVRAERRSRLCAYVEVYRTRGELRQASRLDYGITKRLYNSRTIVAQCAEVFARRRGRRTPEFAIIRLTAKSRTRDISHECFHATLRWAARRGIYGITCGTGMTPRTRATVLVSPYEERAAIVCENLIAGTINGMYDFGYCR